MGLVFNSLLSIKRGLSIYLLKCFCLSGIMLRTNPGSLHVSGTTAPSSGTSGTVKLGINTLK